MIHTSRPARGGFTLIEILISIVILSIVAAGLAGGMLNASRSGRTGRLVAARNAVMNAAVSLVSAVPTTSLAAGTTTRTVTRDQTNFTQTVTITTHTDSARVRIVVAPPTGRGVPADTVIITRTLRAGSGNPFAP